MANTYKVTLTVTTPPSNSDVDFKGVYKDKDFKQILTESTTYNETVSANSTIDAFFRFRKKPVTANLLKLTDGGSTVSYDVQLNNESKNGITADTSVKLDDYTTDFQASLDIEIKKLQASTSTGKTLVLSYGGKEYDTSSGNNIIRGITAASTITLTPTLKGGSGGGNTGGDDGPSETDIRNGLVPATFLIYSTQTNSYRIVSAEEATHYTVSDVGYIMGVLVIPTHHDVYGDGSAAFMSLKYMNCDEPMYGSNVGTDIYFGLTSRGTDYGMNDLITTTISFNHYGQDIPKTSVNSSFGGIPFYASSYSGYTGYQDPGNSNLKYYNFVKDSSYYYGVGPYMENGTLDSNYYYHSTMGNFNGKEITDYFVYAMGRYNPNWNREHSVDSSYDAANNPEKPTYFPAIACAYNYCASVYTDDRGKWYLPSIGELVYVVPKIAEIDKALKTIGSSLTLDNNLMSSTFNNNGYIGLDLRNGSAGNNASSYLSAAKVKAFIRFNPQTGNLV